MIFCFPAFLITQSKFYFLNGFFVGIDIMQNIYRLLWKAFFLWAGEKLKRDEKLKVKWVETRNPYKVMEESLVLI